MREILFRGKDAETGEWIKGFYVCLNGKEHRIYNGYAETDCGDYYPDFWKVDPATVGQFTGLTDKNGKKIFEGDILEFRYGSRYPVFWDCDMGAFGSCYYSDFDLLSKYSPKEIEVIGNIHDNPELLGGAN